MAKAKINCIDIDQTNYSIAHIDSGKKGKKESTDQMEWGDYSFKITTGNMLFLDVLCKYAQFLDFVTGADGDQLLNIDGVINAILYEAMQKRVKELAKKHGFEDAEDFCQSLSECKDGEEVEHEIKASEKAAFQRAHDNILAHIPLEDRQLNLFGEQK